MSSKAKTTHLVHPGDNLQENKPFLRAVKTNKINLLIPPDQKNLLISTERKALTTLAYFPKDDENVLVAYLYNKATSNKPKQFVLLSEDKIVLGVMNPIDLFEALSKFEGIGMKGWKDYHNYSKDDLTRKEEAPATVEEIAIDVVDSSSDLIDNMPSKLTTPNPIEEQPYLDREGKETIVFSNYGEYADLLKNELKLGNHLDEVLTSDKGISLLSSVSPSEDGDIIQSEYSIMQNISANKDIYLFYVTVNSELIFVSTDAFGMILAVASKDYVQRKLPKYLKSDWEAYHRFKAYTPEGEFVEPSMELSSEDCIEFLKLTYVRLKRIKIKANNKKNKKAKKLLKKYAKFVKSFCK